MKKAAIVFYPNYGKKRKINHEIPIYLRISKGNIKVEHRVQGASIAPDDIPHWNQMTQRLSTKDNDMNKMLEDIAYDFKALQYLYKQDYDRLTPAVIRDKLFPKDTTDYHVHETAIDYIENHFKTIIKPNTNISDGTKRNYRKSINHLTNYLIYKDLHKISLQEFSPKIAFEFYDYLQEEIPNPLQKNPPEPKKSITAVSASSVLIKIKALFERAVEIETIQKNPFKKIKLVTKSKKRAELSMSEINLIINLNLTGQRLLLIDRDLFLFAVYTGLAYGDVEGLREKNIVVENGEYILNDTRNKTEEPIRQVLVKQAVELIKKYDGHIATLPQLRIFPYRHLNNVNSGLKLLQAKAGITKNISTHIARHTCNQFLRDLGNIDADIINTMLGWSNGKQGSGRFYTRASFKRLVDAKNKYEQFLNDNLCKP